MTTGSDATNSFDTRHNQIELTRLKQRTSNSHSETRRVLLVSNKIVTKLQNNIDQKATNVNGVYTLVESHMHARRKSRITHSTVLWYPVLSTKYIYHVRSKSPAANHALSAHIREYSETLSVGCLHEAAHRHWGAVGLLRWLPRS